MAWTYSGDPGSSDRDKVRFLIGDVTTADPLLDDAVVDYQLGESPGVYSAAGALCRALAARFARETSGSIDGMSQSRNQKFDQYTKLAATLEAKATAVGEGAEPCYEDPLSPYAGAPYVGGLTCDDPYTYLRTHGR